MQELPVPLTKPKLYTNLEFLRFAAAAVVVVYHFYFLAWPAPDTVVNPRAPFYDLLQPVYDYGAFGVQLFWLLSGFIFFSQYFERIQSRTVSGRSFAVLRFSRLWPLYVTTALFMFLAQPVYRMMSGQSLNFADNSATWGDLGLSLFMGNQWLPWDKHMSLNGPAWSVSVEILAYLLFFFVARFAGRFAVPASAAFALALLVTVTREQDPVGQCISYFFTGGMLFLLSRRYEAVTAARPVLSLIVAVAATVVTVVTGLVVARVGTDSTYLMPFFLILVLACAAMFLPQIGGRGGRLAIRLGNMTYASYMLQFPILITVLTVFAAAGLAVPWQEPWLFFAWLVAPFALAVPVYHWFEMPAQNWLRRRFNVAGTRRSTME